MTTTPEAPAKTLTQLVALEVKLEMVRRDLKQSNLARAIGKNEQWLSVRLRGRQPIDLNDLALIARGLGVSVRDLMPDQPYAVEEVTALYPQVTGSAKPKHRRPADNRPSGHPESGVTAGLVRTARLPRSAGPRRP
jgi:transcriptional regulator with XRE-family HTH domain